MEQRLIDANALTELLKDERDFYKKMYDCMQQPCEQDERAIIGAYYTAYSKSYHIVKDAQTVDAVPVVRCKDCENWDEEYSSGRKSLGNYRCVCHEWSNEEDGFYRYTAEDDYCSCGERREDG